MGCSTHSEGRVHPLKIPVEEIKATMKSHRKLIVMSAMILCAAVNVAPADESDPHAHHRPSGNEAHRSEMQVSTPEVRLLRADGKTVAFADELDDGRPVVMNFIYTSCTTICPLTSQIFEQFQKSLGAKSAAIHLVSVSIDPEQDTPAHLREYAAQFDAAPGWDHYTGTLAASQTVQRAFNAYRGDKMSHIPLTLMRAAPGKPWVRFDGFVSAEQMLAEKRDWDGTAATVAAR
jgi:protein SCO1/2